MHLLDITASPNPPQPQQPLALVVDFCVDEAIAFAPDIGLAWFGDDSAEPAGRDNLLASVPVAWLPRGRYRARWLCAQGGLQRVRVSAHQRKAMREVCVDVREQRWPNPAQPTSARGHWELEALDGTPAIDSLSWRRGHGDWFFRHFDHAATTVIDYMLGNSELLRGRVLDVGCGDGITALGMALRCEPQALIGIDPFKGFERLPQILAASGLAPTCVPDCLRFLDADANAMPFPDDSFDVVVSWGSLEHIAGGYQQALREIRRVLRPDGLFFVHPGLYYSNFGHHLGEFCDEPHFHLKWPEARVRETVFSTPPRYIDRAGEFATPAQYWQWYRELNPITVAGFERELRELGFEPWRVALRTEDRIEYTPELQRYSMQDLATLELYVSCYNRK